jgi:hypothetical protein
MGYCHWLRGQRISTIWGGKHKFVCWAFTLEANSNNLQNAYVAALFVSFDAKSLSNGRKFIQDKNGNPNSPQANKLFFPNVYKLYNFYFLSDFYLVLCREVCSRSSLPNGCSVKRPLHAGNSAPVGNTLPVYLCTYFLGSISVSQKLQLFMNKLTRACTRKAKLGN